MNFKTESKRREKELEAEEMKKIKMGDLNPNTSVITLNVSRLSALIKRQDYQPGYKNKTQPCTLYMRHV